MFANFQKVGKEHCCIDILKSFVRDGVIALAVSLSIQAGILSGPVALVVSSCMRKCNFCAVISNYLVENTTLCLHVLNTNM